MTFDDGLLTVYEKVNIAENGNKPVYALKFKMALYFGFDVLGYNRYYTALQANNRIESVVNVPMWEDIDTFDIVALEDGKQYTLSMLQRLVDEDGLKYTKLSLERLGESYDINS